MLLTTYLSARLALCDPVLARVTHYAGQEGIAQIGTVYRMKHLFADRYVALKHPEVKFIGGATVFGGLGNYPGEVGFLFLNHSNGRIYQDHWNGHFPVQRHEDGLWCVLPQFVVTDDETLPASLGGQWKLATAPRDTNGTPINTLIRFEALEAYLCELVGELDGTPCHPVEVGSVEPWLSALPTQSER